MGITKLEGDFLPVEIRAYSKSSEKTYSDYAIIATDAAHRILAIGKEAYKYIDALDNTATGEIAVYSTFKRNVVAEFDETVAIIKVIYKNTLIGLKNKILKPTIAVCIPFELTGIETKVFKEVFMLAGAKNVTIHESDFDESKGELANNYSVVFGIIPNKL